jgi:hypothetical protein
MKLSGHCLCQKVLISIPKVSEIVTACHCKMCQRFFGSSVLYLDGLKSEEFAIFGESIKVYQSSAWAERAFCDNCGSSLYYHSLEDDDFYYFPVGLFDDLSQAVLKNEIFYDCKPDFYHFAEKTVKTKSNEISD